MKRVAILDSHCLRCGHKWQTFEDSLDDECPKCDQAAKPTIGGATVLDGLSDLPFLLDGNNLVFNQTVKWDNIKFKRVGR